LAIKEDEQEVISCFKKNGFMGEQYLRTLGNVAQRTPVKFHADTQYSPDGKVYVIAAKDLVFYDTESHREINVYSDTREAAASKSGKGNPIAIEFSGDSQNLAVLYQMSPTPLHNHSYELSFIDIATMKELARFPLPKEVSYNDIYLYPELRINPDKKLIALDAGPKIMVFDLQGNMTWQWDADTTVNRQKVGFDATPDWEYFLINLQRIEYPSKKILPAVKFSEESKPYIHSAKISVDGKKAVASGGPNGEMIRLFDLEKGTLIKEVKCGASRRVQANDDLSTVVVYKGIWYPKSDRFHAVSSLPMDGIISFSEKKKEVSVSGTYFSLETAENWPKTYGWHGDGQWMFSPSTGNYNTYHFDRSSEKILFLAGAIRDAYDFKKNERYDVPRGMDYVVESPDKSFALSHKGVMTLADDEELKFLSDEITNELRFNTEPFVISINNIIGGVTDELTLIMYDFNQRKLLHTIKLKKKHSFPSVQLSISSEGKYLEVRQRTESMRTDATVLDIQSGKVLFNKNFVQARKNFFTQDEKFYVVINHNKLHLFDTTTWEISRVISLQEGAVDKAEMSPDNKSILVTNTNGQGQIIDMNSGETKYTLMKGRYEQVVVFDEEGKEIFSTDGLERVLK
jgi:WD40 repeat protein